MSRERKNKDKKLAFFYQHAVECFLSFYRAGYGLPMPSHEEINKKSWWQFWRK